MLAALEELPKVNLTLTGQDMQTIWFLCSMTIRAWRRASTSWMSFLNQKQWYSTTKFYISKNIHRQLASLSGKALENVEMFRYLGCDIKFNEPSTCEAELNLRTDAATGAFYGHSRNMMNQKIYMKTRVIKLNSLVCIRLVYGCQKIKRSLQGVE